MKRLVILASALLTMGMSGFSQEEGNSGMDSSCAANLKIYQLRYANESKTGVYTKETFNAWRNVFFSCPQASKNMYMPNGVKMYTSLAQNEKDAVKKQAYIDTVMMIYDRRIQYLGEESRYIGLKGADLYVLSPEKYSEAYDDCRKSFDIMGEKSDLKTMVYCLQTAVLKYQDKSLPKTEVISLYQKISDVFDTRIAKNDKESATFKTQKDYIDNLFLAVNPDCNDLVALFEPQFNATPTDTVLLRKITNSMSSKCASTDLYFKAAVELDKLEPSALSKRQLGDMYAAKSQESKAIEYYKQALDMETDNSTKAETYYKMAYYSSGSTAVSYANRALSLNSRLGKAYLIIASKYAESANSCSSGAEFPDLEKWKIYWLAYDMCMKAKSVDSSISSQANSNAASYKTHFPDAEALFGYNITEGTSQTVGCWINATTTAKVK